MQWLTLQIMIAWWLYLSCLVSVIIWWNSKTGTFSGVSHLPLPIIVSADSH